MQKSLCQASIALSLLTHMVAQAGPTEDLASTCIRLPDPARYFLCRQESQHCRGQWRFRWRNRRQVLEAVGPEPRRHPGQHSEEGALKLQRKLESEYASGWLKNIMADAFA